MTDNIVDFVGTTTGRIDPQKVISKALEANMEEVLILGWKDGELYAASSTGEAKELIYLWELFKSEYLF